jgi:hypothetical protein
MPITPTSFELWLAERSQVLSSLPRAFCRDLPGGGSCVAVSSTMDPYISPSSGWRTPPLRVLPPRPALGERGLGVRGADWAPVARPATSGPVNKRRSSARVAAAIYDLKANHSYQPSSDGSADKRPKYRHDRVTPIGTALVGDGQERMRKAWSKVTGRIDRITSRSA